MYRVLLEHYDGRVFPPSAQTVSSPKRNVWLLLIGWKCSLLKILIYIMNIWISWSLSSNFFIIFRNGRAILTSCFITATLTSTTFTLPDTLSNLSYPAFSFFLFCVTRTLHHTFTGICIDLAVTPKQVGSKRWDGRKCGEASGRVKKCIKVWGGGLEPGWAAGLDCVLEANDVFSTSEKD